MKNSNLLPLFSFTIFLILIFNSCVDTVIIPDETYTTKDFTHLNILLAGAPINMEEINIDIKSVNILTDKSESKIELSTLSDIYNLLEIKNEKRVLLASSDLLNVKTIYQIEIELGDRNNLVIEGVSFPLILHEKASRQVKVFCNISLVSDMIKDISLYFDAEKSITTSIIGEYILQPHITIID